MAAKIKLKRLGKIRTPQYRIIVADARSKRDGRAIEELGFYHPKEEPSFIQVNSERVQYWLGVGAQPTAPVLAVLKITGDWQKYKGLPGAEGTLRFAAPKQSREDRFAAALAAAHSTNAAASAATTPRGARPTKAADASASDTAAPDAVASDPVASDAVASDTAATDAPPADSTDHGAADPADTSETTQGEAADTRPAESAAVEAVAQDPTAGGGELPEAAVAADSAPTSGTAAHTS